MRDMLEKGTLKEFEKYNAHIDPYSETRYIKDIVNKILEGEDVRSVIYEDTEKEEPLTQIRVSYARFVNTRIKVIKKSGPNGIVMLVTDIGPITLDVVPGQTLYFEFNGPPVGIKQCWEGNKESVKQFFAVGFVVPKNASGLGELVIGRASKDNYLGLISNDNNTGWAKELKYTGYLPN